MSFFLIPLELIGKDVSRPLQEFTAVCVIITLYYFYFYNRATLSYYWEVYITYKVNMTENERHY